MLSAVIVASDGRVRVSASPEAMVRTLASLVPAAIEGLIRDVTLAATNGTAQAAEIADHAGCALALSAGPDSVLAAGLAAARGDLVLILRAGRAPEAGFIEEITDMFGVARTRAPAAAILRASPATLLQRLFPGLGAVEGLIVRKAAIAPGVSSLEQLRGALASPREFRCRLRLVA